MKSFKDFNYRFVYVGTKVIAISSYAGQVVKGIAKCHPGDRFDIRYGKDLAAARCNEKISKKRYAAARKKFIEAEREFDRVQAKYVKAAHFYNDSYKDMYAAHRELNDVREQAYDRKRT